MNFDSYLEYFIRDLVHKKFYGEQMNLHGAYL